VFAGDPHEFSETARIEVGPLELSAHRDVSAPTIVALAAGDVVRRNHAIADLKRLHAVANFDHYTHDFMTENDGAFERLKTNLVDVG
jgi:hypothetical protein